MKKMITFSTALLLAVSLSACDNEGNSNQPSKVEKTPPPVVNTNAPSETVKEADSTIKAEKKEGISLPEESIEISAEPTTEGKADYQKLSEWENYQEKKLGDLGMKIQQQVQQAMTNKAVPVGLEENIKQYRAALVEIGKSIESLTLNDNEIKALAIKKRDLYNLSGEGLLLTVEAMTSTEQSVEAAQKFENRLAELSTNINQLNTDIMKMQEALDKKYP